MNVLFMHRLVRDWIEAEETARAKAFVKSAYRCDRVGQLSLDVRLHDLRSSPVYVPVFVFRSTHFGSKLRTFVSGEPVSSLLQLALKNIQSTWLQELLSTVTIAYGLKRARR